MKPNLRIGFIICLALFVGSCVSGAKSLIIGNWEIEGAPMKMTAHFKRDGTATLTMLGQTLQGTYKVNGENELEWTVNGRTTTSKIHVTATELEITNDENQTVKYKRT